jgi:hypothetical protein
LFWGHPEECHIRKILSDSRPSTLQLITRLSPNQLMVGDAKYKHLAKGQQLPLRFRDLETEESGPDNLAPLAGQVLSPADVRQLTVYAELFRLRKHATTPPSLMLLYPYCGCCGSLRLRQGHRIESISFLADSCSGESLGLHRRCDSISYHRNCSMRTLPLNLGPM